jgi:23S rRNA (adenine2503-C2)-methyltransferase
MDKDLKSYTALELRHLVEKYGRKPFLADYLFAFIHQKRVLDLNAVTPLPAAFREQLIGDGYFISSLTLAEQHHDPDGTTKLAFDVSGGGRIEAVRLSDRERQTLCLSTQVGCRMGCSFCATGRLGFERNLTAAQIVDQVYQAQQLCGPIHNVVYMGMGEPLDNLDEVMRSVELLNHERGVHIGIRRITLSTCGLPEGIRKLADFTLHPRLAVSLHSADDRTRQELMPIAKKYPLVRLVEAMKDYQLRTGRRLTIEYCLIRDVNDSDTHARSLLRLLKGLSVHVNLIEMNPFGNCPFAPSPPRRVSAFAEILTNAGIETVIRFRRGQSIKAACGQLGATRLKPH